MLKERKKCLYYLNQTIVRLEERYSLSRRCVWHSYLPSGSCLTISNITWGWFLKRVPSTTFSIGHPECFISKVDSLTPVLRHPICAPQGYHGSSTRQFPGSPTLYDDWLLADLLDEEVMTIIPWENMGKYIWWCFQKPNGRKKGRPTDVTSITTKWISPDGSNKKVLGIVIFFPRRCGRTPVMQDIPEGYIFATVFNIFSWQFWFICQCITWLGSGFRSYAVIRFYENIRAPSHFPVHPFPFLARSELEFH